MWATSVLPQKCSYLSLIMPSERKAKSQQPRSSVIHGYLLAYNGLQYFGWLGILLITIYHGVTQRSFVGVWDQVKLLLMVFQTAAILEIIHGAIRIVQTNPVMALMQIFSRVFITWGILHCVKDSQNSIGVPLLMFTWSITEIVRYSFYTLNLLSAVPQFLVWCRYTFFYFLYPMGVTGELLVIYAALPYIKSTQMFSFDLPNRLNISFNYYLLILIIMWSYIPLFPQLYMHMIMQRKKILTPKKLE